MPEYLIDVNLPRHFTLWRDSAYLHQCDLGDDWPDSKIWKFAQEKDLTIITKDSDFSSRIIFHTPPPKVIHVRLGNLKIKQLEDALSAIWPDIIALNKTHKLVNIFTDRIEGIR